MKRFRTLRHQAHSKPACRRVRRFRPTVVKTSCVVSHVEHIFTGNTKDVCSCTPGMNAATAAEIMWTRNCGSLPVVEDGGRVVGIVTDRDLFLALGTSNRKPVELSLGEIMSRELALCNPSSDVRNALRTMAQRQLRRLPVVDEAGNLKGILSLADVALRADDALSMDVLNVIRAVCDRRNRRKATQRESFWSEQAAA